MSEKDLQKEILDLKAQVKKLQKNNLGLVFEDKTEDVVTDCRENIPVLKEVKAKRIISDEQNPNNLLIEGDNYHALSVLNYTHKKNIDLIYIDPPYNTGNKDFTYNDQYVDVEDSYRHSKWLSFMRNRLVIARELLTDEGMFFISIDDNEQAHLRILCDKIFGEGNFLGDFIWQKQGNDNKSIFSGVKTFRNDHEYILVYGKNASLVYFNRPEEVAEFKNDYGNTDNDSRGNWMSAELGKSDARSLSHGKNYYTLVSPSGVKWVRQWHYNEKEIGTLIKDNRVYFGRDGKSVPRLKKFLDEKTNKVPSSLLTKHGSTKVGQIELDEILGERLFSYPKSTVLIEYLIKLHPNKSSTVLDFFAGSGTTGHAVLNLNIEDGGNRKFILCTNNELNGIGSDLFNKNPNADKEKFGIISRVTYPRIEKIIKGYKDKKNEKVAGLGGNLSYYQTDLVNIEKIHKIPDEAKIRVTYQAGEMIAVREDTLGGVEKNEWWQIFEGKGRMTAIYFKEDKSKLVELIEKLEKKNTPVALYIFSWGKNEYKGEYSSENIRVEDIPEPILEVYKEINRI